MDDTISRRGAIKAIKDALLSWSNMPEWRENKIVGALDKLPSAQQWIPCSRELPKEDGQYIVTVKYEHIDGYEDVYSEHGEWIDGKWDMFCSAHCGEAEDIIAWMPLPEPWEGEQNG